MAEITLLTLGSFLALIVWSLGCGIDYGALKRIIRTKRFGIKAILFLTTTVAVAASILRPLHDLTEHWLGVIALLVIGSITMFFSLGFVSFVYMLCEEMFGGWGRKHRPAETVDWTFSEDGKDQSTQRTGKESPVLIERDDDNA